MLYYQEYSEIFKGPFISKEKIDIRDLLNSHHSPLWFILLGSLFAIFGFKLWVVYFAQAFLGALTIWLIYLLGRKTCFPSVGLLSAFILPTLPSFLIITRQGFLETMMCPIMLIGVILAYRLLEEPSMRLNYIIFGFICGIGMLVKSTFFVPVVLLLLIVIVIVFADRKKIDTSWLLRNCSFSFIVMILIILPWYAYAHRTFLDYFMTGIDKGRGQFLFDIRNIFTVLPIIKNAQLGNFYFFLFITAIVSFGINPKPKKVVCLIFFLIPGYLIRVNAFFS